MKKVLVITGGSRGIGEATIKRFMNKDWRIVNLSRTPSPIANVINLTADLQKPESLQKHSDELKKLLDAADNVAVVHNAAFYERDCVDTMQLSELQKTLAVNIVSPSVLNSILIPYMPEG